MEDRICPKCNGSFKPGYTAAGVEDLVTPVYWISGRLERKRFTRGADVEGRTKRAVITYCCDQCGFLEACASPETS